MDVAIRVGSRRIHRFVKSSGCLHADSRAHVLVYRELEAILIYNRSERYGKMIAVIIDPQDGKKILRHLVKVGRPPPGLDPNFV